MSYLTNSIGSYTFAEMTGAIFYRQEQIEVINRPGVDGSGLRKLGARGQPFELMTKGYWLTLAAAQDAIFNASTGYKTLIAAAAYTVTRNGVNHGDYYVLDVQEVATTAVLNPTGNVPSSSCTALLVCRWKLIG